ncbi:MAG: hypothetical protein Q8Q60_02115 [Candidatus Chromulinivorax sp.]|nr:hypothetical protein [Candidatus Chromulinivorax sp.]
MKKKYLIVVLSFIVFTSVLHVYADPDGSASVNLLNNAGNNQSNVSESSRKPLVRRDPVPRNFISPEEAMLRKKQAASGGSAVKNLSVQNSVVSVQDDEFFRGRNALRRSQKNNAPRVDVGESAQPVSMSNVQTKIAMLKNQKSDLVSLRPTVPVQEGYVKKLTTNIEDRLRRSSADNNIRMNQVAFVEQSAPQNLDGSDLSFGNVYNPEIMDNDLMYHHLENPLNNDFNMENLYDPEVIPSEPNVMRELPVNYSDVYHENNSFGSALRSSQEIDNRYNPLRPSSSRELVVYDRNQKYQKPVDASLPLVLYESQSPIENHNEVDLSPDFGFENIYADKTELPFSKNKPLPSKLSSVSKPITAEDFLSLKTEQYNASKQKSENASNKSASMWEMFLALLTKVGVTMSEITSFCRDNFYELASSLSRLHSSVAKKAWGLLYKVENGEQLAQGDVASFEHEAMSDIYQGRENESFEIVNPMKKSAVENSKIVKYESQARPRVETPVQARREIGARRVGLLQERSSVVRPNAVRAVFRPAIL